MSTVPFSSNIFGNFIQEFSLFQIFQAKNCPGPSLSNTRERMDFPIQNSFYSIVVAKKKVILMENNFKGR